MKKVPKHLRTQAAIAAKLALASIARVSFQMRRRPITRTSFINMRTGKPVPRRQMADLHIAMTTMPHEFTVNAVVAYKTWDGISWDAGEFDILRDLFGPKFTLGEKVYKTIEETGQRFVEENYRKDTMHGLGNIITAFPCDISSEQAMKLCETAWQHGFEATERGLVWA